MTHIVSKQLHDESGDAAVDADEDVHAGEDDVRRAGDLKEEGGRVHQRSDGPAGDRGVKGTGVQLSTVVKCSTKQHPGLYTVLVCSNMSTFSI